MTSKYNIPNLNIADFDDVFGSFESIIRNYLNNYVFTAQLVQVHSIPADNAFVNVVPVLQNITMAGELLPITDNDVIYNVPMMTLFGNNCEISFLTSVGDKGLLIACNKDISNYKASKTTSTLASSRRFSFSDGVFIPLDFKTKSEGIIIRNTDTVIEVLPETINITTSTINVNSSSATVNSDNVTVNGATVAVNASSSASITAPSVGLGGSGGKGVAREGDTVEVYVTSGSSAGTWQGIITSGSNICSSS